mmetsp:Transcript_100049/g.173668  ORF Transcript_100049/g.173668 Transcript_100049/m.173668 type:complete len:259 (+) Transcript_100049:61-837(+)
MAKRKHEESASAETGLAAQVMIVTGGSSGLGQHIVSHFAGKGWKVYAVARGEEKLKAVCAAAGANAIPVPCNVAEKTQVDALVTRVLAEQGRIDVLVQNSAVGHPGGKFWELDPKEIDFCIDINLKGVMYLTHSVLKLAMVPKNTGFIFGIASVAGLHGIPTESCYVASKHGMIGFLDTIALETRDTGICVSTICPGGIDTPWWNKDHPYSGTSTHADGTTAHLIQTQELVDLMDYQLSMPRNRVFKRVVLFPKNETH